jgi:hypothetical protein
MWNKKKHKDKLKPGSKNGKEGRYLRFIETLNESSWNGSESNQNEINTKNLKNR